MRVVKSYLFPVLLGFTISSGAMAAVEIAVPGGWPTCAIRGGCNTKPDQDSCYSCCDTACGTSGLFHDQCFAACP